ncbi:MAG: glycosyltransferase [Deltaproteobacteria bacterium]
MLLDDMIHVGFFTKRSATLAFHFLIAARLSLIMERHCCRHLHAHFADAPTDIAMYAARLADISFSFTARSSDLFKEEALIIRKVARSAKAITISNYNRNLMITQGADGDKIVVIHSGVDCLRFGSRESRKERSGPMPLLIGSIGRLIEKKGFGTLIQAANLLVREGMKFRIEIVGEGPWKAKLEQLIRYAGVFDRITFIGSMPNNLVPAWLAKLDIFVLACRIDSNGDMDSIPMPLIEAMAASVPVVSTNISAIPELIENGVSGLLARSDDPSSLSEAIWSILDDTDLQYRCINAACQKVKKDFSEDTNVEKLACLFKEIILPYRFDLQDSQIDCNKTL